MPSASDFATAARTHLSAEMADTWLSLLRPAIRLTAADRSQRSVGHLGGKPLLPIDMPWPPWDEHGPLTYVAGLDCARLPSPSATPGLPTDGQLLFFYFDGKYDNAQTRSTSWASTPSTSGAAQALTDTPRGPALMLDWSASALPDAVPNQQLMREHLGHAHQDRFRGSASSP